MTFYNFIYKTFRGFVKRLFRVEIVNPENEFKSGSFMVCSNHTSAWDPVVTIACTHHIIRYMAKKELFRIPGLAAFLRGMKAFPVDRRGADVGAIKNTISMLESGECVGIFPQGTRCKHIPPEQTKVRGGAGMMAYRSKADVLPILIKTEKYKLKFFRKTKVIFGEPIKYGEFGFEKGGNDEYQRASEMIFSRVCALDGEK